MADDEGLQSDDYVVYGTAVEQLAEDETASSKPVPIQEQIATDEKGRRRFHGAFTGGFSAGYFNSVGSIEGWTPRTFQSSRQKKGEASQQRPEDYMDTEDMSAHGIAPKRIVTTDSFGSRAKEATRTYGVSSADVPLKALLAPLTESYGVVLLKKMGWKPGQGIGPRITKREKYRQLLKDGKIQPISEEALQAEERLSAGRLFAPEDTKSQKMEPKTNYHGIGYKGLDITTGLLKASTQRFSLFDVPEVSTALAVPTAAAKQKKIRGITGQAFGVGAFENDDEDIYTMDDMSRYDRVLGEAEKTAARKEALKSIEAPGAPKILEGFQRGTIPLHQPKLFAAPVLPRGFTGQHGAPVPSLPQGALQAPVKPQHPQHDANSRSAVLSDHQPAAAPAPPVVKSVFDLIPDSQKARIPTFQSAKIPDQPTVLPRTALNFISSQPPQPVAPSVPTPSVASVEELRRNNLALYSGASVTAESKITFQPFAKDPEKQQRYEMFLKRRHIKGTVALDEIWMDVGASMTEWEREREKGEFFRAAALYRPMSGAMAARFTRETEVTDTSNTVEVSVDSGDVTKERKTAAEKKLYGKLTRDTFEWHPDRLVSKRFNVPNPYPTSTLVGILKVKRDKFSMFNFLNVPEGHPSTTADESSKPEGPVISLQPPTPLVISEPRNAVSSTVPAASEPKKLSVPEKSTKFTPAPPEVEVPTERPPMDLFRAIFDSSDVEDDTGDDAADIFPTVVPASVPESDPFQSLLDLGKKTRALEKKDFPSKPEAPPPVVGPERPPPAVLATYAALASSLKTTRRDSSESSEEDRHRRRKKKEKSKRSSDKRHKKRDKLHKKSKTSRSSDEDNTSSRKPKQKSVGIPATHTVRVPATESSPDVEVEDISAKLRALIPGKRLTAADFM